MKIGQNLCHISARDRTYTIVHSNNKQSVAVHMRIFIRQEITAHMDAEGNDVKRHIQPGDLVRFPGCASAFRVVFSTNGENWYASHTMLVTNPSEWELVP